MAKTKTVVKTSKMVFILRVFTTKLEPIFLKTLEIARPARAAEFLPRRRRGRNSARNFGGRAKIPGDIHS
jgi:hypothetical protein